MLASVAPDVKMISRGVAPISAATFARAASTRSDAARPGPCVADAGLPLERRREIGVQELERLHSRAAALETIVKNIKEATNV